jgi:3-oxoacyl-(acyl-carrier-protein) synthase
LIGSQQGLLEHINSSTDKLKLLKSMNHMVPFILANNYYKDHGVKINGMVQSSTMASATGGISIGEAYRWVKHGY